MGLNSLRITGYPLKSKSGRTLINGGGGRIGIGLWLDSKSTWTSSNESNLFVERSFRGGLEPILAALQPFYGRVTLKKGRYVLLQHLGDWRSPFRKPTTTPHARGLRPDLHPCEHGHLFSAQANACVARNCTMQTYTHILARVEHIHHTPYAHTHTHTPNTVCIRISDAVTVLTILLSS